MKKIALCIILLCAFVKFSFAQQSNNALARRASVMLDTSKLFESTKFKFKPIRFANALYVDSSVYISNNVRVANFVRKNEPETLQIDKHAKAITDAAITSNSSWIGATLFYNLDGAASFGNVVGAAKIILNTAKNIKDPMSFNVIGNIAKITSSAASADLSKAVTSITQTDQGLSVGAEFSYKIVNNDKLKDYFCAYGNLLYKLNDFQNVNNTSNDISLSQGRFALGIQYEGLPNNDNELWHFGIESGINFFDSNRYQQIFNDNRGTIVSLETTLIMPIASRMGLMLNYTFSERSSPVFGAGLIIKSLVQPSK